MGIEKFISIASFAISVGGLVSILKVKHERKEILFAVIVAALVVTSSFTIYSSYQHNRVVKRVETDIIEKLSHNTWTFDHIYEELHYVHFQIVNEALFLAVEEEKIGYRMIEFRNNDGAFLRVRGYYVKNLKLDRTL